MKANNMNPTDHSQILFHAIFSTQGQLPLITPEIEPFLYDKITKILFDDCYSPSLIIGGDADHLHLLIAQSREWSADAIINRVKNKSAEFMRKRPGFEGFAWQESYGAFTVSRSEDEIVKNYIATQKEFHNTTSFKDEFREILKFHEIEFDEDDLWE